MAATMQIVCVVLMCCLPVAAADSEWTELINMVDDLGDIFKTCTSNCHKCSSRYTCDECDEGYYKRTYSSVSQCRRCSQHCSSCYSSSRCSTCKTGYYLESYQCQQLGSVDKSNLDGRDDIDGSDDSSRRDGSDDSNNTAIIAAVVASIVVVAVTVVVVVCIVTRRRIQVIREGSSSEPDEESQESEPTCLTEPVEDPQTCSKSSEELGSVRRRSTILPEGTNNASTDDSSVASKSTESACSVRRQSTILPEDTNNASTDDSSVASKSTESACNPRRQSTTEGSNNTPGWTNEDCEEAILSCFEPSRAVHNASMCSRTHCNNVSAIEQGRLKPKKFQHSWLNKENWWLCYVEGEGMFCIACRKHNMKHPQNQKEVFAATPGVRMKWDAIKSHSKSHLHSAALESETLQRVSVFHKEAKKQSETHNMVLEQTFSTAYFLMSTFIANRQFVPLLNHIEKIYNVDSLKYFGHRSRGAQREIFVTLGQAMKENVVSEAKAAAAFGLLVDEVSDVSVEENLVTFIQYFSQDTGKAETRFLSCQNVLTSFESANSEAISSLILQELEHCDLNLPSFTGLTSDGASVMVGKRAGVAARLKQVNPTLLNVHCVCHRLALACVDSNQSLTYISNVETLLRQLWQYFENSPKRMAAYLKVQSHLKSIHLEGKAVKRVTKRLKKACRTRWLSFEAAVTAVHEDYEAILQTLAQFQENDAAASGLLSKMKKLKFIGVIYMLRDILPILGDLSRRFQKGSLMFASIVPAINMTKDKLQNLVADAVPMEKLSRDIDSFTDVCAEIKMNQRDATELRTLFENYTSALVENIDNRFADSSPVLKAFNVFDPMLVPDSSIEMRSYGQSEMDILCKQYFLEDAERSDRLKAEWEGMKYHLRDVIKPSMPESVKCGGTTSPIEWCLLQLLKNAAVRQLYPTLHYIAEVIVSLPVSNAWPERGASTLKALKTRLRNRLGTDMLESLLHICINAPQPSSPEGQKLVKTAVTAWLDKKNRRKLPKQPVLATASTASDSSGTAIDVEDAGVQTDPDMDRDDVIRTAVDIALKKLNIDQSDSESDWSGDELEESCCSDKL